MDVMRFVSFKDGHACFQESLVKCKANSPKIEFNVVNVFPDVCYDEFLGFGAAITESAAYSYSLLPEDRKRAFMQDVFSEIKYSFCRLTIGSCDFSLGSYSYAKKHDLSDFSIERDLKYVVPFIRDALRVNPNIRFLASPWSPPGFMKNTKISILGGKLLDKYKQCYADYFVRFILAYRDLGINIDFVTIQNEPNALQIWESCLYSADEEADFLVNFLSPTFKRNGIDTKILIYDQNKDKVFSRAKDVFSVPGALDAASGVAFHWYTGDHFDAVRLCREFFPDMLLIHTEGCSGFDLNNPWAPPYAHDIIGDLNAGSNGYIDWNILLDGRGGPNHKRNFCNSPVLLNSDSSDFVKTLAYYYIGHFSRFILPGARRVAFSKFSQDIQMTAFRNLDGSIVAVLLNDNNKCVDVNFCCGEFFFKDVIPPDSIVSYVLK